MNKFMYFLAVGLAFTVLQVTTVEADMIPGTDCAATPGGPDAVAACFEAQAAGDHPCSGMTGDALIACTEENPPPSGASAAGGPPTLTLEDPKCQLAPADRDPGCPVMHAGTHDGMAPGTHDGMAPGTHDGMAPGTHDGMAPGTVPMCGDAPCPPPEGGDDGVALTIDDPRCIVAPEARDHRCPGFVAP